MTTPSKSETATSNRSAPMEHIPPPRLKSRGMRVLWGLVYWTLYRFSPVPLHAWRCLLLKAFGATVGAKAHPYPKAVIWAPWNLTLGEAATLANGVTAYSVAPIILGKNALASQGAYLCTASHDYNLAEFPLIGSPIVLEDNSWVAADAFVGPGVTVGEGGMVVARGVAVKDVEAWTIVGGNPAKYIKRRTPTK